MPTSVCRIGQISDIHVWDDADLGALDFLSKRATGWLNFRMSRREEYSAAVLSAAIGRLVAERPDLVVVSGDVSNLGLRSELLAARATLQPLRDAGILVTVIPGNHDYYLRSSTRGEFESVFADMQQADARIAGSPYPYLLRVGAARVLHFNSAIATPPLGAWGRVGTKQLDDAGALLDGNPGGPVVVAMHHHPVRALHKRVEITRELKDAPAVRAFCVQHSVALVVHGHNHYSQYTRLGRADGPLVVGVSSGTTNRTEPEQRRGEVAIYELDASGLIAARSFRYNAQAGAFSDVLSMPLVGAPIVA